MGVEHPVGASFLRRELRERIEDTIDSAGYAFAVTGARIVAIERDDVLLVVAAGESAQVLSGILRALPEGIRANPEVDLRLAG
jgi:hypothetical protein